MVLSARMCHKHFKKNVQKKSECQEGVHRDDVDPLQKIHWLRSENISTSYKPALNNPSDLTLSGLRVMLNTILPHYSSFKMFTMLMFGELFSPISSLI